MTPPRSTLRTRLTLLYTGLFAGCGVIVVAVSYTLVAQLGTQGQNQRPSFRDSVPASIAARCHSELPGAHPDKNLFSQCINYYLQQQGAQAQRDLTLSHLLQYSLMRQASDRRVRGWCGRLGAGGGWLVSGPRLAWRTRIAAAPRWTRGCCGRTLWSWCGVL